MNRKSITLLIAAALLIVLACAFAACNKNPDGSGVILEEHYTQLNVPCDDYMDLDGKLDEDVYDGLTWVTNTYPTNMNGNMPVLRYTGFTTELGMYISATVNDTNVRYYDYGGVAVGSNSSWEIYFVADKKGEAPREERYNNNMFVTDVLGESVNTYTRNKRARFATHVEGEINSGDTEYASIEMFVPWSQYGFTAEEIPEEFGVVVQYHAVIGSNAGTSMIFPGYTISQTENYSRMGKTGFMYPDLDGAEVGDTWFGRSRTSGWDISRAPEGVIECTTGRGTQTIYFKAQDAYAENFSVKTKIVPVTGEGQAGLYFLTSDGYEYVLFFNILNDYTVETANGKKTLNRVALDEHYISPTWHMDSVYNEPRTVSDDDEGIDVEVIKFGSDMYTFADGKLIACTTQNFLNGKLVAGFRSTADVIYKNYSHTTYTYSEAQAELESRGIYAVSAQAVTEGGAVELSSRYASEDKPATLTVTLQSGYEVSKVTQNGQDITANYKEGVQDGVFEFSVTEASQIEVTFAPVADAANISGNVTHINEGVSAEITATGDKARYLFSSQQSGEFTASLPAGDWVIQATSGNWQSAQQNITLTEEGLNDLELDLSQVALASNRSEDIPDGNAMEQFAVSAFVTFPEPQNTTKLVGFTVTAAGSTYAIYPCLVGDNGNTYDNHWLNLVIIMPSGQEIFRSVAISLGTSLQAQDGYDIGLIFREGKYTVTIDGKAYHTFGLSDVNASDGFTAELFSENSPKLIGLTARDMGGEKAVFKNIKFTADANETAKAYDDALLSVTATVTNPDGGTATWSDEKVYLQGESVLTVAAKEGFVIESVLLNGNDISNELSADGTYTLTKITDDVSVEVTFGQKYTVTGTLDFSDFEGYDYVRADDEITVRCGAVTGTVDGNTFTIDLPQGERKIVVSSNTFEDVTLSVSVTGEMQADEAKFIDVKEGVILEKGETAVALGKYTTKELQENVGNCFMLTATVKTADSTADGGTRSNNLPSFYIKSNGKTYLWSILTGANTDDHWGGYRIRMYDENGVCKVDETRWLAVHTSAFGMGNYEIGDGAKVGIAFKDGVYYWVLDGKLAKLNNANEPLAFTSASFPELDLSLERNGDTIGNWLADMFSTDAKEVGITTNEYAAKFENITYTPDWHTSLASNTRMTVASNATDSFMLTATVKTADSTADGTTRSNNLPSFYIKSNGKTYLWSILTGTNTDDHWGGYRIRMYDENGVCKVDETVWVNVHTSAFGMGNYEIGDGAKVGIAFKDGVYYWVLGNDNTVATLNTGEAIMFTSTSFQGLDLSAERNGDTIGNWLADMFSADAKEIGFAANNFDATFAGISYSADFVAPVTGK